jgi:hypothetical protein
MEISEITYPDLKSVVYLLQQYPIERPPEVPLWRWLGWATLNDRLVNKTIYWEEKRDGSNFGLYLDAGGNLQCRTRNAEYAQSSMKKRFMALPFAKNIEQALSDAKALNVDFVIFGEYLEKGTSPARYEQHETDDFQAFDIWNDSTKRWFSFEAKYDFFKKYGIPQVALFSVSTHQSVEDILEYKRQILEEKCLGKEGTVGKVYLPDGHINFFKEKNEDKPKVKAAKSTIIDDRDELPDSEIYGAVNKAYLELGMEQFMEARFAMPLIAQLINIECEKHNCKMTRKPMIFYKQKLEDMARG